MDQRSAIRLLNDTFINTFDIGRFTNFVKELFNHFTVNRRDYTRYIAKEYQEYIASFEKLGDYENSKKEIEVLIVGLNKTSSRDRARTMQRNFIANWLGKTEKDAALVAFYGEDPQDWRFSFVKMEYQLVKDTDGKVKILKELTPAKRYSFLVGKNEPNHTCRKQFLEIVMEEDVNPSLDEIEAAFSIENVTKEFFLEYKDLYLKLKDSLEKISNKNSYVKKEFEQKGISIVDFAKKLLGQIVFIYFLQKKGWLGVEKDKKGRFNVWGSGPKNFLRKLYDREIVPYDNFFNDILEPLFYEALATERDDNYYSRFNCKIPFLNGGLFEPINDYDWAGTEILLDNSIFEHILDTFDRFNFTVKEDEPLEKEVAIDPEMLGKVFENLIEENIRKGQGAYYTPREIVHYMCQQSLINYLETNINLPRKDIEKFIQLGDLALDLIIKEQKQVKRYGISYDIKQEYTLPKSIKGNYLKIDELLRDIKIVDPAVGSGAFPVGMMNEIVKARSVLSIFFNEQEKKKRTSYNLKRETIENSLYGVDIDSSAVDIAKLRFWLSLIVDELDMKNIKPLPNLDHKIMCGNSLLEEFEGIKLFDERLLGEVKKDNYHEIRSIEDEIAKLYQELGKIHTGKQKDQNGRSKEIQKQIKKLQKQRNEIAHGKKPTDRNMTLEESSEQKIKESQKRLKELKELQQKFFNEQNRSLKKKYAQQIDKIEWDLIEETLKEQENEEAIKKLQEYKKSKSKPFFLWKLYFADIFQKENPGFDIVIANPPYGTSIKDNYRIEVMKELGKVPDYEIYYYFIELSKKLLRLNGIKCYIIPNTFLFNMFAKEYKKKLLIEWNIIIIIDCTAFKLFDSATVYNAITIFQKVENPNKRAGYKQTDNANSFLTLVYRPTSFVSKEVLLLNNINWGLVFKLPEKVIKLISKIKKRQYKIKDFFPDISQGLIAYDKYRGQSTEIIKERKYHFKEKIKDSLKEWLWGSDVTPYKIEWNKKEYIDYCEGIANPRTPKFFKGSRILIREITNPKIYAAYTKKEQYHDPAIIVILDNYNNILPLLGILNSKLATFYHFNSSPKATKGAFPKVLVNDIKEFPIPDLRKTNCLIPIINQILSITKDDDYLKNPDKQAKVKKLAKEIDQLVYKIYNLTPEEIKIVEGFNKE